MRRTLRSHGLLPMIALLAVCVPTKAQPNSFTIEQVMSAPFPSDLVAAPAGDGVAWVFDAAGARNVWVAEPPDYKGRALTSYASDDGQDIAELAWTPDARSIVYVRGGDLRICAKRPIPAAFRRALNRTFGFCRSRAAHHASWPLGAPRPCHPTATTWRSFTRIRFGWSS